MDAMKLKGTEKIIDFIDDWPKHIALYNGQNIMRETFDIGLQRFKVVYMTRLQQEQNMLRHSLKLTMQRYLNC
jgi:hypothetical protein